MTRNFEIKLAVREQAQLMLGFVGASGTGKTYSALRVAAGIQSVCGGDIHVIDTEARRALHYAPQRGEKADPARGTFDFKHLAFGAPFSPLDYLAAIEHCVKNGARTVVIDSMSHEHESVGGVLEIHEAELKRMAGDDYKRRERMNMLAWQKPKAMRRALITSMLQMECNFLLCFRAKPKLRMVKGEEPVQLGYMPIAGDEFVYEMALKFLFLPGANGVPVTKSEFEGERAMIKVPHAFREYFREPKQLTEDTGVALASWAAGDGGAISALLRGYAACADEAAFLALESQRQTLWGRAGKEDKAALKAAAETAQRRVSETAPGSAGAEQAEKRPESGGT